MATVFFINRYHYETAGTVASCQSVFFVIIIDTLYPIYGYSNILFRAEYGNDPVLPVYFRQPHDNRECLPRSGIRIHEIPIFFFNGDLRSILQKQAGIFLQDFDFIVPW